jgi:uncharacterized protein YndB with AHSA1/START domain
VSFPAAERWALGGALDIGSQRQHLLPREIQREGIRMETYHFVTNWHFHAPMERVWDELIHVSAWPTWWSSWRKAQYRGGESQSQLGSLVDNEVKGTLPYALRFTTEVILIQPPQRLEFKSSGDTVGSGKIVLEQRDNGTAVTYYWDVATTNAAFNLLGKLPFVRAMIEKNHAYVMDDGYHALKQRVER